GALLVTRAGRVAMAVEGRGRRIVVAPSLTPHEVTAAARALAEHLHRAPPVAGRRRELVVETIDGIRAIASPHTEPFRQAGYRVGTDGLRWMG
ncbi:MAG TPA: hypothetical protein VFS05_06530, partial [Gemmatimonadaceae bacterium]|nr:hypothetical protein [Gemmatimonadaceae bacterium]